MADCRDGGGKRGMAHCGKKNMGRETGSIITPEDEPLCGHAALRDSMQDLILDLVGALIVAVYGFIRHDKLIERYKQIAAS